MIRAIFNPTVAIDFANSSFVMTHSPMSEEGQKFMSLSGLRMWARAIVTGADRMGSALAGLRSSHADHDAEYMLIFNAERHLFAVSAYKLIEHVAWAKTLSFLDHSVFAQIEALAGPIKQLRDLNEHALEYFRGPGLRPQEWTHSDADGSADASSTMGTLLGGRLDYKQLAQLARELRDRLPKAYWPPEPPYNTTGLFVWSWDPLRTSPSASPFPPAP
jgi:hypothetical protein